MQYKSIAKKETIINNNNDLLILVDGSSYLYRAYYALPSLYNSAGEPTGAIYGVLNMLRSLLIRYSPTYIVIVFDAKGKTFRNELFKYYKYQRPSIPKDLQKQIEPLYDIIHAIGFPLLSIPGVEADDVIGTLTKQAREKGCSVLISTSDKDMEQLVTSDVTLINTMNSIVTDPNEIKKKYGIPPYLIIDLLALIGDYSDNIPGVPGIGRKTAQALLQNLGGIISLYKNLNKIPNFTFWGAKNAAEKLEQYKDTVFLSYQLATIKTDVNLKVNYEQLMPSKQNIGVLSHLFHRYEFRRWLVDLEKGAWLEPKNNARKDV